MLIKDPIKHRNIMNKKILFSLFIQSVLILAADKAFSKWPFRTCCSSHDISMELVIPAWSETFNTTIGLVTRNIEGITHWNWIKSQTVDLRGYTDENVTLPKPLFLNAYMTRDEYYKALIEAGIIPEA
jgi:hypothetical protein